MRTEHMADDNETDDKTDKETDKKPEKKPARKIRAGKRTARTAGISQSNFAGYSNPQPPTPPDDLDADKKDGDQ